MDDPRIDPKLLKEVSEQTMLSPETCEELLLKGWVVIQEFGEPYRWQYRSLGDLKEGGDRADQGNSDH